MAETLEKLVKRINGNGDTSNVKELDKNHLQNVLTKEVKRDEVFKRLEDSKQDKIKIKEILLESEIDFTPSVKKLQDCYSREVADTIGRLSDMYNNEVCKVDKLFRSEFIGKGLADLAEVISPDWCLVIKKDSVNLYKCYNPPYEVIQGYYQNNSIIYDETVCFLRSIYVNIMNPKMGNGTIYLSTEGRQHPNCTNRHYGTACPGTLDGREIPIDKPKKILVLLQEIASTYEKIHLDSSYYKPDINYEINEEDTKW